ncbi:ribulose-phosphate 3-epimerase [Lentibacillus kapialis]|uniref:Ribulose-phosphate 3-epimerase n=1 Tax=Lentibacillus kapialis TaxID=340214 RepID=A0A917PZG7_9BACI|nr:ribulose-phosphate 3-epimerase [Lentibacillus kapialis]GGK00647.1 ribulose-phosphate 3-epimerase [Lentibacillus kapialis]
MKIAPSVYAADIMNLNEQLLELEKNGIDMLHVDVMDGHFVKGMAFGQEHVAMIRRSTAFFLDVHLMVRQPERVIPSIAKAGADMITVHAEATEQLKRTLQQIKKSGVQAGVVLNPGTQPEAIRYVLNDIEMVLIMTVNPGEGGQAFMEDMLPKIAEVQKMVEHTSIDIEVDGSIDDVTAKSSMNAGANIFVSGSYVFNGNITEQIVKLKKVLI